MYYYFFEILPLFGHNFVLQICMDEYTNTSASELIWYCCCCYTTLPCLLLDRTSKIEFPFKISMISFMSVHPSLSQWCFFFEDPGAPSVVIIGASKQCDISYHDIHYSYFWHNILSDFLSTHEITRKMFWLCDEKRRHRN